MEKDIALSDEQFEAALESVLFIYGEAVAFSSLAKVFDVDADVIGARLASLQTKLKESGRGLRIIIDGRSAQMVTAPEYSDYMQEILNEEFKETLSPASLETLSIIAYRAPISRSEIDYIRGVNSSFILRALLVRGIIERYENPNRLNTYLYKPSFDFLRMIGLERIEDLPEYSKYNSLQFQQQSQEKPEAPPAQSQPGTPGMAAEEERGQEPDNEQAAPENEQQ